MADHTSPTRLRSRRWFDDRTNPGMTALYLERYMNWGLTPGELRSGKPIIGIAQTGSDLSPCNRHHVILAERVRDGIRDAGGIPLEFPIHPIQETGKRPTAGLDRNLAYLSLVEVLHGYPLDGVVLTAGCDKTVPAVLMGAATVNIPSILLSGGPMLDGWFKGRLAGSGTIVWEARKLLAEEKIDYEKFLDMVAASASSVGHCNTMGTALSMNSLAEALGMSLPGCAAIPGPHKERGWMAYETGKRIVGMVAENLRPSDIMTKKAFENAVVAAAALGASSNCPISMIAIARHMGVDHTLDDWQRLGADIPLLTDVQPAGRFLGEGFFRAGGVPAVLRELKDAGKLQLDAMTCTGQTLGEVLTPPVDVDREVIRAFATPMKERAGFIVLSGNLFDAGIMKISVVDEQFRNRFLADPEHPEHVRGQGGDLRGAGGLPRPDRGPGARDRRAQHPGDPQLRAGGVSGQRGGGEHAAAGVVAEAGDHGSADDGRWAAVRHVGEPEHPEHLARGGGGRRAGAAAERGSAADRPERAQRQRTDPGGGADGAAQGVVGAAHREQDAVGRDLPQHGRARCRPAPAWNRRRCI